MGSTVNINEASTRLLQLIEQVEGGEQVTIVRGGRPVAKLVAVRAQKARQLGVLEGRYDLPTWLDEATPDDVVRLFESGDPAPR